MSAMEARLEIAAWKLQEATVACMRNTQKHPVCTTAACVGTSLALLLLLGNGSVSPPPAVHHGEQTLALRGTLGGRPAFSGPAAVDIGQYAPAKPPAQKVSDEDSEGEDGRAVDEHDAEQAFLGQGDKAEAGAATNDGRQPVGLPQFGVGASNDMAAEELGMEGRQKAAVAEPAADEASGAEEKWPQALAGVEAAFEDEHAEREQSVGTDVEGQSEKRSADESTLENDEPDSTQSKPDGTAAARAEKPTFRAGPGDTGPGSDDGAVTSTAEGVLDFVRSAATSVAPDSPQALKSVTLLPQTLPLSTVSLEEEVQTDAQASVEAPKPTEDHRTQAAQDTHAAAQAPAQAPMTSKPDEGTPQAAPLTSTREHPDPAPQEGITRAALQALAQEPTAPIPKEPAWQQESAIAASKKDATQVTTQMLAEGQPTTSAAKEDAAKTNDQAPAVDPQQLTAAALGGDVVQAAAQAPAERDEADADLQQPAASADTFPDAKAAAETAEKAEVSTAAVGEMRKPDTPGSEQSTSLAAPPSPQMVPAKSDLPPAALPTIMLQSQQPGSTTSGQDVDSNTASTSLPQGDPDATPSTPQPGQPTSPAALGLLTAPAHERKEEKSGL